MNLLKPQSSVALTFSLVAQINLIGLPSAQGHAFENTQAQRNLQIQNAELAIEQIEKDLLVDETEVNIHRKTSKAKRIAVWEKRLYQRMPRNLKRLRRSLDNYTNQELEHSLSEIVSRGNLNQNDDAREALEIASSDRSTKDKIVTMAEKRMRAYIPVLAKQIVDCGGLFKFIGFLKNKIREERAARVSSQTQKGRSIASISDGLGIAMVWIGWATVIVIGAIFTGPVVIFIALFATFIAVCATGAITGDPNGCQ